MANIATLLQKIASAIYGKDMREAIHDSIEAVNNDLENDKILTDGKLGAKADKAYNKGFVGGQNASLGGEGGAALGLEAKASKGAAAGAHAQALEGGSAGNGAYTSHGGSVGQNAYSLHGASIGRNTKTRLGVAAGDNAQTVNEEGEAIDAIQLGTGTNTNEKTFKVYEFQMMDKEGHIPSSRIANGTITHDQMAVEYARSAGQADTYTDTNLNTLITNGIYSVSSSTPKNHSYPYVYSAGSYNDTSVFWSSGTVIVCETENGYTQIFVNDCDDTDTAAGMPAIAIRTKHNNRISQWYIIDNRKLTDIYKFSENRGNEVWELWYTFDTKLYCIGKMFILLDDYNVSGTVSGIPINDEVRYNFSKAITPGVPYIAQVTKYHVTGADHEDGEIEIIGEIGGGQSIPIQSYSTTSVQVGTWIDGTPIWRKAFEYTFDTDGISIFKEEKTAVITEITSFDGNPNTTAILNGVCWLRISSHPCMLDDIQSTYINQGVFAYSDIATGLLNSLVADSSGFYGYIDYMVNGTA